MHIFLSRSQFLSSSEPKTIHCSLLLSCFRISYLVFHETRSILMYLGWDCCNITLIVLPEKITFSKGRILMCKVNLIPQFVWKSIIFELLMNIFPLTFPFPLWLFPHLKQAGILWRKYRAAGRKKSLLLLCCPCSVAKSCPTLWDPMSYSTLGFSVLHYPQCLLKFRSTESGMLSHRLIFCCPRLPFAFNLSQHQSLFQ